MFFWSVIVVCLHIGNLALQRPAAAETVNERTTNIKQFLIITKPGVNDLNIDAVGLRLMRFFLPPATS